jgi:hypothetical protein
MEREIGSVPLCFRAITAMRRGRDLVILATAASMRLHVFLTRRAYLTHNPLRVLSFARRYLD